MSNGKQPRYCAKLIFGFIMMLVSIIIIPVKFLLQLLGTFQVLADRSPGLLDFHLDLVSLEATTKVLVLIMFYMLLLHVVVVVGGDNIEDDDNED
ncbi:hypothetical protein Ahy_B05g078638 [Arachis hypogaea]|uniref:Uncharacterized protein n=1 Tax=Arachis hypogaea TaxID=3818 RepID=A0A444Z7L9_ARAHY|nr:hypothetical protein Ahy_B05g078638 [Arachis hypogaea]